MTYLSSSATTSRGVSASTAVIVRSGSEIGMASLQFFDREIGIRVDANIRGDTHRFFDDLTGVEGAVTHQRARRRHREAASRPDRHDPVVWFDEIASAREQKRRLAVGDDEHRLETS